MPLAESFPMALTGPVHIIPESDVDTDMIFHNRHLHLTDRAQMAPLMFGNLKGYEGIAQEIKPGDILIVGANFGCGSSRQQAVDGLIALGVAALVGVSFGAIYKRNAINAGLPLIECRDILSCGLRSGRKVTAQLQSGAICTVEGRRLAQGTAMSQVAIDIYRAGGLLALI